MQPCPSLTVIVPEDFEEDRWKRGHLSHISGQHWTEDFPDLP